jgi:hypothetical protein
MWLLVDEFNSQYWWNYPTSLRHWAVIVRTGSSAQLFWYLSTRMGLTFCSFSARSMGCNVHVTTRGWFNSQYWWNYPISLDIETVIVRTGSSSSTILGISQLGWALPFCSFSARSMGCNVHVTTRGWIQLAVLVELPISLTHWSRYCTYRLFQLQLFWYLSGWALTFFLFTLLNGL